MLNNDGHVSEGSGENIVIIRDGKLITPARSDNVLEGITLRDRARAGAATSSASRSSRAPSTARELYVADEVFMTGTAAHVTPSSRSTAAPSATARSARSRSSCRSVYFDIIYGRVAEVRSLVHAGAAAPAGSSA